MKSNKPTECNVDLHDAIKRSRTYTEEGQDSNATNQYISPNDTARLLECKRNSKVRIKEPWKALSIAKCRNHSDIADLLVSNGDELRMLGVILRPIIKPLKKLTDVISPINPNKRSNVYERIN